ncbi:MAG: Molybdopterin-synthase adenylyltransferase [Planctomycetota bacterium]|jgi:adenylyltransferase/sulfurtransferase
MTAFDLDRYSRQTRFPPLGAEGQAKLAAARVVIVGCGALGSASAVALARAGVGSLRLIDRDLPEPSNLPRQLLFDEADAAEPLPKVVAAARHLARINSATRVEPMVADLVSANAVDLLADVDVIVDGTDNLEARYLINEVACRTATPWVHGAAVGGEGRVLTVLPGRTACLRCLVPDLPPPGALPTCETAGILGPAAMVVGAVQATEAIKLIVAAAADTAGRMLAFDLWSGDWRTLDLAPLAAAGCPTCRAGDAPWLEGQLGAPATELCGRDAVHVPAAAGGRVDLSALADRLAAVGPVTVNEWMLRADVEPGVRLSVFADGRVIVTGTRDQARARSLVARYL